MKKTEKPIRKKSELREWVEAIVVAFFLAMFIRTFFIQAFKIPSGSMRPTLKEGDLILVNKFIYGLKFPLIDKRILNFRKPKRGDVIVFVYPEDKKKDFIKRLVGLPGEEIEIIDGTVYINNNPLTEPPFNKIYYYNYGPYAEEGKKIVVPKDSYFVLGDNSVSSKDSRYWGYVPAELIKGKAIVVYWPPMRIRLIK